jgi:hypothetical protein
MQNSVIDEDQASSIASSDITKPKLAIANYCCSYYLETKE